MELARLLPHTDIAPTMRHWRNHHGDEVDIVLEDRRRRIVAIEVKASATVGRNDLRAINKLGTSNDRRRTPLTRAISAVAASSIIPWMPAAPLPRSHDEMY